MILYVSNCCSLKEFTNIILGKLCEPEHGCNKANIIIANLNLYENYYLDGPELSTTVNYINSVGNVNVTLIESLSELITVLGEHFLDQERHEHSDLPIIDKDTKIIGLYGIFDHFITKGNQLMARKLQMNRESGYKVAEWQGDAFMDLRDYSAKSVNYICSLMYNLKFYRKYQIYFNEPYEEVNYNKMSYIPIVWNKQVPNLQPEEGLMCDVAQGDSNFQQGASHKEEDLVMMRSNRGSIILGDSKWDSPISESNSDREHEDYTVTDPKQVNFVPLGLILSKWAKIV